VQLYHGGCIWTRLLNTGVSDVKYHDSGLFYLGNQPSTCTETKTIGCHSDNPLCLDFNKKHKIMMSQ